MDASRVGDVAAFINKLPRPLRPRALSKMVALVVPYVGTTGLVIERLDRERVIGVARNRRRARNHIGGVHAAASVLLAETVTGFLVAMNLPGDKLPLIKTMHADFLRRARGDIRAETWLEEEQRRLLQQEPKGAIDVAVQLSDA
ncbi:MAG: DUF4442 domain-containing protein, partial [Deltaproteobacteria bacterium]